MPRTWPGELGATGFAKRLAVAFGIASCSIVACFAAPAQASNPIQTENALTGDTGWKTADAPQPEATGSYGIEGYAKSEGVSPGGEGVLPGGTLDLYVRGVAASGNQALRYRIVVERLGWYGGAGGRQVACLPNPNCSTDKAAVAQPAPPAPDQYGKVDAGWNVTDTLSVGANWVSGYYMAKLVITNGTYSGDSSYIPFIVLPPASQHSAILVVVPINTWQAYNTWGGESLYAHNPIPAAFKVSLNRPLLDASFGYNRPFYTEYPLVRFLEREGYDVSYVTDYEVDHNPQLLLQHRLVIDAGHDEYWTDAMRNNFEAARDAGTNLIFMGADTGYWQVRYEDSGRTIVGYKELAIANTPPGNAGDPLQDSADITSDFRDPPINRPEGNLMGVEYGEETPAVTPGDYSQTYTVVAGASSDPWMTGTLFHDGDTLPHLVGYEVDRYKPWREVVSIGTPTMLFHWDDGNGIGGGADAVRFTAPSGARIFSTGSIQFVWGLDDYGAYQHPSADPRLQQFMRNALADMTTPAAPASLTPTVNLNGTVGLAVTVHADPRLTAVKIYSHAGQSSFAPTDFGVTLVCTQTTFPPSSCTDSTPGVDGSGWVRYEAVTVDQWGVSAPLQTAAVNTSTGTYNLQAQDQSQSPIAVPLTFTYNGTDHTAAAPNAVTVIKDATGSVSAPPSFIANALTYTFQSWSDGGAQQHSVTPFGSNLSSDPGLTANYVSSDPPPVALLGSPTNGTSFTSGQLVTLSGSAINGQGGTMPGSELHWTVVLTANSHTVETDLTGTNPSFTPDAAADPIATYAITLTAFDTHNVPSTPITITLHVASGNYVLEAVDDQGGGHPIAPPLTFTGSDGSTETQPAPNAVNVPKNDPGSVSAPTTYIADGYTYTFQSWSDTGQLQHAVTPYPLGIGVDPQTLTATYHRFVRPPTATIIGPADGSDFASGRTIALLGSASDPQDGTEVGSQLSWSVVRHANGQVTALSQPSGANPAFVADAAGDPNATYVITVTATDSRGAVSPPVSATIHTLSGKFVLDAQDAGGNPIPAPLTFSSGGVDQTAAAPNAAVVAKASQGSVSAPMSFISSGYTYTFQSWSDGGAQTHAVAPYLTNLNDDPEALTATYARSDRPPVAQIIGPADGSSFVSGQPLTLHGSANDPEDGVIPDSGLSWTVIRRVNGTAAVLAPLGGSAPSFTPDAQGDPNATYFIALTATDSHGVKSAPVGMALHAGPGTAVLRITLARSRARTTRRIGGELTSPPAVSQLRVALRSTHEVGRACKWWSSRLHRLDRRACNAPVWLTVDLIRYSRVVGWHLPLNGVLPHGHYVVFVRAFFTVAGLPSHVDSVLALTA